ncbi:MAG TPA: cache domain-containing protein, partial [Methylomirabilota bacterium]|nr:cache domain-containing protein [Methylomirabilota bacterium]
MRRGGLARRYLIVLVALVTGALVAAGAIQLRTSYIENQAALVALQTEKAHGAAARIEAFVRDIERQLTWTTHAPLVTTDAALDARQLDALRLQRQAPPITELTYIDATGHEQLFVSRLIPDRRRSGLDVSQEPKFQQVRAGRPWFGPVYFRKDSEPYMTIAAPLTGGGVVAADVNLKFILDVVSQIKVGKTGLALAIDGKDDLIAHPDISLVLQKTNLGQLPQVKKARTPREDDDLTIARDLKGVEVLTAHSRISSLGWIVFVEQPVTEALASVRASAYRIVGLVLGGIALSIVASVVLARRLARPIQQLQESAARIGAGEMDHQITLRTGDELEALADEFNRMTGRLRESYVTLEQKVDDRTRELSEALEQQTATGEILRVISASPTNVQPVLDAIAEHSVRLCSALFSSVYRFDGELIHMGAHFNYPASALERSKEFFPTPPHRRLFTARAILERAVVHVPDISTDREFMGQELVDAAGFRAVVSVPMLREGVPVGAITVWHGDVGAFSDKQIALLGTFADQAVIAIENVRLFTELESKNSELGEALEQQTATGEILRAISGSPTDVQPVFDAIVQSALRLLDGHSASVLRLEDETLHMVALTSTSPAADAALRTAFPAPLARGGVAGHVVQTRQPYVVMDTETDALAAVRIREVAPQRGY